MGSLVRHDMLSGNACNLWWIVGYLMQVMEASHREDSAPARAVAEIVQISSLFPGRTWVAIRQSSTHWRRAHMSATVWALGIARGARELALFAALAAFVADAYFYVVSAVHENHFFVVIPLLGIAAGLRRPRFTPILTALGVVFALNLCFFYFVAGGGPAALASALMVLGSTLFLSLVNCAVFLWFAMVFRRACDSAPEPFKR